MKTKYCIKCGTELIEDADVAFLGALSGFPSRVVYCPNKKCKRFGLQTWVWLEKKEKNKKGGK